MIQWIRHSDNYEMRSPEVEFPIAAWISSVHAPADGRLIYSVTVYAGATLIASTHCIDFEAAEKYVIAWLEKLRSQLETVLRGGDRHA